MEAVPLSLVTAKNVTKFLWVHIITRFGIPHTIISDNGTNFEVTKSDIFAPTIKSSITSPLLTTPRATAKQRSATAPS